VRKTAFLSEKRGKAPAEEVITSLGNRHVFKTL
jgi:hypothetical protein